jgi:hypothetical protein
MIFVISLTDYDLLFLRLAGEGNQDSTLRDVRKYSDYINHVNQYNRNSRQLKKINGQPNMYEHGGEESPPVVAVPRAKLLIPSFITPSLN